MNKPAAFVLLLPGFAADESDSTCMPFHQQFARRLKKAMPGTEIIIMALQYPYFVKSYSVYNCTVYSFSGKNKGGIKRLLLRKKIEKKLAELFAKYDITGMLSCWLGECAVVGEKAAKKFGVKHYCWLMGQDAKKENTYFTRGAVKPENLIAISETMQVMLYENFGWKPGHVIFPGVNSELFNDTDGKREFDIAGIGSLIPLKQYDLFVDIVADLKISFPSIKTVLIGSGPEYNMLADKIKRLELEDNITLTGECAYTDTLHFMQRTKIVLHPSLYEGFSGVCMEALCAGAHVISFCRAVTREVPHWHIVKTTEEMTACAITILKNPSADHSPVIISEIDEPVKQVLALFD